MNSRRHTCPAQLPTRASLPRHLSPGFPRSELQELLNTLLHRVRYRLFEFLLVTNPETCVAAHQLLLGHLLVQYGRGLGLLYGQRLEEGFHCRKPTRCTDL